MRGAKGVIAGLEPSPVRGVFGAQPAAVAEEPVAGRAATPPSPENRLSHSVDEDQ